MQEQIFPSQTDDIRPRPSSDESQHEKSDISKRWTACFNAKQAIAGILGVDEQYRQLEQFVREKGDDEALSLLRVISGMLRDFRRRTNELSHSVNVFIAKHETSYHNKKSTKKIEACNVSTESTEIQPKKQTEVMSKQDRTKKLNYDV